MKIFSLLIFLFSTSVLYSQVDSLSEKNLNIKFYNKGNRKISIEDCKAWIVFDNDTILSHPDSIYKIKYSNKNTKLIVQYNYFYAVINSYEYMKSSFRCSDSIAFIEINLSPRNRTNSYVIVFGCSDLLFVEDSARVKGSRNIHTIYFKSFSNPINKLIK